MNREDGITCGILGSSLIVAILVAVATLMWNGCVPERCGDPIVHPTEDQKTAGADAQRTDDPPYVPWWADETAAKEGAR